MSLSMNKNYNNFIGGQWIGGSSGEYYEVLNPADINEIVGEFPLSTSEDVETAVFSAHKQFQIWRKVPPCERADYVYRFIKLLDESKGRLAEALTKEQGKPYKESLGEVTRGVKEMYYVAGEAARLEGITVPSDRTGVNNSIIRVPIGVIAAITPWNFPVLTPLRKVVPALICGCTVVLKPATNTPLTSVILTELFEKAGLPAGTLNLLIGSGRQLGNALVSHPLIKGISFTGSTKVGRNINKIAASNFTKVQLEMGGKNPTVVAHYKDLEWAATQIVTAAYVNAGQRCTAISRVIVTEDQADKLEQLIVNKVNLFKIGDGMDEQTQIGPIVSNDALLTIEDYVKSAAQEGAKVLLGGRRLTGGIYDKGYYFEPTVITNVTQEMRVAREEIFGPVLVVIRVDSFDRAIEVCNNTEYGLAASIFTDKMAWAYDFTENVESGMLHINHGTISEGHMPFGGTKNSGHGPFSIGSTNKDFYTELKVIYTQYNK